MAIESLGSDALNITGVLFDESLLTETLKLVNLFQAIGGLIIAYIIFNILNILWNRKRTEETTKIRELLEDIKKKLGRK